MLEGFRPVPGVHCETTMLNNMLRYSGIDVSEALIFGLGRGIDAQFFPPPPHTGIPPMLTGRVEPGRIAADACAAMGLTLVTRQDADDAGAHARAVAALSAGSVVGVTVDIFHLDYFASQAHFSAHCIALHGLDDSTAYVADTSQQGGAQQLPLESFTRARASDEGFMPSPASTGTSTTAPVRRRAERQRSPPRCGRPFSAPPAVVWIAVGVTTGGFSPCAGLPRSYPAGSSCPAATW